MCSPLKIKAACSLCWCMWNPWPKSTAGTAPHMGLSLGSQPVGSGTMIPRSALTRCGWLLPCIAYPKAPEEGQLLLPPANPTGWKKTAHCASLQLLLNGEFQDGPHPSECNHVKNSSDLSQHSLSKYFVCTVAQQCLPGNIMLSVGKQLLSLKEM